MVKSTRRGRICCTLSIALLAMALAAGPAEAGPLGAALAALGQPSQVSADPAANAAAILANFVLDQAHIPGTSLVLHVASNGDGTFTLTQTGAPGAVPRTARTPYAADPSLEDRSADPTVQDYTVTDGSLRWDIRGGADADALSAQLILEESSAVGGGAVGSHAVFLCLPGQVPLLLGCLLDTDRDGYSNHQEILAGSDPTSVGSVPDGGILTDRVAALRAFVCPRAGLAQSGVASGAPIGSTCADALANVPEVS